MIPFNKPVRLGTEESYLAQAIEVNGHVAGGGPFGKRCEALLETLLGERALLVTSATHALEMAALLLDLAPGDEFIVPSFTFVSTANAFVLRGARPVFADVDLDGNLVPEQVEQLLTPRTRAVVPVHYAGNSCDLSALAAVCGAVPIVEDAAQALGARFDGRPLGTFGACAAISFHETKNVGCGEGGALIVGDERLIERAEHLRDKGTNRRQYQDGLVDKYTWVDLGSSYALSDLNAAYLCSQLEQLDRIQARRKELHDRYARELRGAIERAGAHCIQGSARVEGNQHLFAIVFREPSQRSRCIAFLREREIVAPFHYVALHQSPMGKRFHDGRALPVSDRLTGSLLRLPLFFNLTDAEQEKVILLVREFLGAC